MTSPKIDVLRRGLQRAYLDHLKSELMPKEGGGGPGPIFAGGGDSGDFRAVARVALQRLQRQMQATANKTQDAITSAHLQDCEREIDVMLTYKK
jgi:hypothetical protein